MKSVKILSLLLVFIMLIAAVAACSDSGNGSAETTAKSGGDESNAETTEAPLSAEAQRNAVNDDLPEEDFGGYNFRMYYFGETFGDEICPEEISGDVIMDAVYERNMAVEERFNVKITAINSGFTAWDQHTNSEKNIIMAGDDAFDLTFGHIIGAPNNSIEGLYINFHDIPYLNFDKPWWQDAAVNELTLNGKMFVASNDLSIQGIASAKVIFFNKARLNDYSMDEPYQAVFDHKWTLDSLISQTKDVFEDINGDGVSDRHDFYGYISHRSQNGFMVSFDIPVLKRTNDDSMLQIDIYSDKMISMVEKVFDWYFAEKGTFIINGNDPETGHSETQWQADLFADGRSLYAFSLLNMAASTFRVSDVEYGILPFPLWDEKQADYITFSGGNLMCVPVTTINLDRTGVIIEAMSAEGYKQVIPAYFETALKDKFTFDTESGQVLDIINNSRAISFAYAYDNWQGFGHCLGSIFGNNSKDFTSYYEGRIVSAEKRLGLIVEAFS